MKILLLLLLFPGLLHAQADSTRLDSLGPITISATRIPVVITGSALAVSILSGDYIRTAQPQLSLNESLAAVPGLFLLNDANYAQDLRIALRGFGARAGFGIRGIKILLDGIPESAPDGQAQVDNLDLAATSRIEVLRGASGGLYGNASGGVISLSTDPVPEQAFARARLSGGSFGFGQLHAQGGWVLKNSGFRVSASQLQLNGYRAQAFLRSTLANGQWAWRPDTNAWLRLLLNYAYSPRADDPGALSLGQVTADRRAANPAHVRFQAGESVQQGRAGLVFEKKWPAGRGLRLRAYSSWRDFFNRLPFQNGGQVAFQRWFAGGGGQYDWETGSCWRFSTGVDLDRQTDRRQRYDNLDGSRGAPRLDQQETFSSAGAFGLAEWKPHRRWTLSGGLRFDLVRLSVTDFFDADGLQSGVDRYRRASPWAGAVFQINSVWSAYGNLSTNFETPTLAELSNNPTGVGGFNAELIPQRSLSLEAGLRGRWPAGFRWELAGFRIRTLDELAPYELPDFPGRTFYRNSGESLRQGLELALRWASVPGLDLGLSASWAGFRFVQYETPAGNFAGKRLPGLPAFWGMAELRYRRPRGLLVFTQTRFTGRYFADDGNATAVDPYVLTNLRLGWEGQSGQHQWSVFAGADNLFGVRYFNNIRLNAAAGRYYEPGSRAAFFAGVEWRGWGN